MTTHSARPSPRIALDQFDGVSARPQPVDVWVDGDALCIAAEAGAEPRRVPLRDVQWPERQRHGARVAHLRGGASLHCADAGVFDAWARQARLGESWVVKAQQSWRWTAIGAAALIVLAFAGYRWGLPLGARAALAFVPASVDRELGDLALDAIRREGWLAPSALPAARQQALRAAWAQAAAGAADDPGAAVPDIRLHFHSSRLGPNAFALPGGHVVVTDEMVALADGQEDALLGVLAHEASHVRHRHGMRMLAQSTLLGTVTSLAFGDFSGLLAATPALLGHLAYSRDFEREADGDAIALLQANGRSPAAMADLFERMQARQRDQGVPELPIALGSHPADAERIARFRAAARGR